MRFHHIFIDHTKLLTEYSLVHLIFYIKKLEDPNYIKEIIVLILWYI
jgi:hypothetical protein